ncbi:MAG: hypothetical protein GY732_09930 [Gammaproteobacteria bacterium]|nr:hypothetical protein [Gammaproteobacteria bacterium]
MKELSPRARKLIAAQRDRYLAKLPAWKSHVEQLWAGAISAQDTANVVAELTTIAHRLAGSAGNFGLVNLGQAALALEQGLKESRSASNCIATSCQPLIDQLLTAFNLCLEGTDNLNAGNGIIR